VLECGVELIDEDEKKGEGKKGWRKLFSGCESVSIPCSATLSQLARYA